VLAHPGSCLFLPSSRGALLGSAGSPARGPRAVAPCPASRPSLVAPAVASHDAIARGVSPYPVDDDGSGRAEHQGCHDEDGGQDDQDDDPDVQDVLGEGSGTCGVREVHPARERQRGDGADPSFPPIARNPTTTPSTPLLSPGRPLQPRPALASGSFERKGLW